MRRLAGRLRRLLRRAKSEVYVVLWAPHPMRADTERALGAIAGATTGLRFRVQTDVTDDAAADIRRRLRNRGRTTRKIMLWVPLVSSAALRVIGRRRINEITGFITAVGAPRTHVVLLTTGQDRLVEVAYVKEVEAAGTSEISEWVEKAEQIDLSYEPVRDALASLGCVRQVSVVPWRVGEQELRPLLERLLDTIGVHSELPLDEFARPPKLKDRTSRKGLKIARAMHAFADTPHEHELITKFVREQFPAKSIHDLEYLTRKQRQRVLRRYDAPPPARVAADREL